MTARAVVVLILYNLVFWLLLSGSLAWETHLGGFVLAAGDMVGAPTPARKPPPALRPQRPPEPEERDMIGAFLAPSVCGLSPT